ncbi:MAG: thioredoxin family protein [Propionicimonas sp.]|uniref:thioredoxin family protein n=1 Tax=Propionicimonas sp. TaxID=1955623 RepID=UPI002B20212A|nr:thioredoxin family protein [Propionicimonas sp.]MEA4945175.1 thioredoxin family protein [Propionicimonas sp.]MEA5116871.1 thioredoxin family protein [Propionicimonas sp.]
MTGLIVALVAVAVAAAFGLYRRITDGRARPVREDVPRLHPSHLGRELGTEATLVQFSSPVCAPCRTTHTLLASLAAEDPGLVHIDLDATEHLGLTERFGILRTPTVLVLDPGGAVRERITGAPRRPEVLRVLAALQPSA